MGLLNSFFGSSVENCDDCGSAGEFYDPQKASAHHDPQRMMYWGPHGKPLCGNCLDKWAVRWAENHIARADFDGLFDAWWSNKELDEQLRLRVRKSSQEALRKVGERALAAAKKYLETRPSDEFCKNFVKEFDPAMVAARAAAKAKAASAVSQPSAVKERSPVATSKPVEVKPVEVRHSVAGTVRTSSSTMRGSFNEPYCSKACYDTGGGTIAKYVLAGIRATCGFCEQPVLVKMGSPVKLIPFRKMMLFMCPTCQVRGKEFVLTLEECCVCSISILPAVSASQLAPGGDSSLNQLGSFKKLLVIAMPEYLDIKLSTERMACEYILNNLEHLSLRANDTEDNQTRISIISMTISELIDLHAQNKHNTAKFWKGIRDIYHHLAEIRRIHLMSRR